MLLGFGLGALVGMSQGSGREDPRSTERRVCGARLRERAIEAQRASTIAAQRARELTALY
jgi:hypothetical protein